jgi:2-methylthioadenine synthetase
MKRTGNPEIYLGLINEIRASLPDAVIRSTMMLGFPGEDRKAFDVLMKFIKDAKLDWMGSFLYSREEDTVAFDMRGEEEHEKAHKVAARWQKELEKLQSRITEERLERFVGNTYSALVEEIIEGEDLAIARIYSQAPEVDGSTVIMGRDMKVGDIVKVGIRKVRGVDLEAVKI